MELTSSQILAINWLIDKFELKHVKADILFKQNIRRFTFTKVERFTVMDIFYYYLRYRFLLLEIQKICSCSILVALTMWYSKELSPSINAWWIALSNLKRQQFKLSVDNWWFEQVIKAFSLNQLESFVHYVQDRAPTTLLVLLRRINKDKARCLLEESGLKVASLFLPTGLSVTGKLRYHDNLFVDVQDISSQMMALLLPEEHIHEMLDYCAGYGGKSMVFASLWPNLRIIASDIRLEPKDHVLQRSKRAGISLKWMSQKEMLRKKFRFVLVDAPCSGSGVWRRNPEDRYRFKSVDVESLSKKQLQILLDAGRRVQPNGYLLYVTCSFTYIENEEVIMHFLQKTNRFIIKDISDVLKKNCVFLNIPEKDVFQNIYTQCYPYLRVKPVKGGGDLFFATLLQRIN